MAMSNAQQGTRGLSAGDWIRLQRLRGARNFEADKPGDITGTVVMPQTIYSPAMLIPRDVGTSRIRRPASFYTDFRASQTADFVTQKQRVITNPGKDLDVYKVCGCPRTFVFSVIGTDPDVIYIDTPNLLTTGAIVVFNNLSTEGTIIKNNIMFYVVDSMIDTPTSIKISISQTPNGPVIDPSNDGPLDVTGSTITITEPTPTLKPRLTGCQVCSKTPVHKRIQ